MITRTERAGHIPGWQQELAQAITRPAELFAVLALDKRLLPAAERAARLFKLRVPRGYVARMQPGDIDDPLLRQVLPLDAEFQQPAGFVDDPVGDLDAMTVPGVLHKYHGRALMVVTGACAIHCRYCFRRHFPYGDANPARGEWQQALDYIDADPSINEIILSGGDPLSLPDHRLAPLADSLAAIPHLKRLRIHTRQPVVLPERIDERLTAWLAACPLSKIIVTHFNHPAEINAEVCRALARLKACDVALFNQAVLLHGVNDRTNVQARLSEALFAAGVLPYYLHYLDRVQGAAHFETSADGARELIARLRARLPGYLVPRLVMEEPGETSKTVLGA